MSTVEYTVTGMTCGHCEKSVVEEVTEVPGVVSATADRDRELLRISTGGELTDEQNAAVIAAVAEAGYQATRR